MKTQSKPEKLLYESGKKPEFLLDVAYVGRQPNMNQDCTLMKGRIVRDISSSRPGTNKSTGVTITPEVVNQAK